MSKLVLLKSYYHKYNAEMAVGLLKDNGIEAILQSDDAGGFRHHLTLGMGNNRVMIQEKDAEQALQIILPLEDDLSEEELKKIEEMAVQAKEAIDPNLKKKSKRDFVLIVPLVLAVMFLASHVFQYIHKHKYNTGFHLGTWECEEVVPAITADRLCREYYISKKLRWTGYYKGDKATGSAKEFFESGQLRWEGVYAGSLLNGPIKEYFENGQIRTEGFFVNNQMQGIFKEYFRSGELKRIMEFEDDELHGNLKTYDKKGKLLENVLFQEGARFDDQGKLFEGRERLYYENGQLWEEWHFVKGRLEGVNRIYFENGNLETEFHFKKGKLNGESSYYYENGKLQTIRDFHENIPTMIKEYNPEGRLIFQGRY